MRHTSKYTRILTKTQVYKCCLWECREFRETQRSNGWIQDRREGKAATPNEVTGELSPQRGLDVHLADLGGRTPSRENNWSKGREV